MNDNLKSNAEELKKPADRIRERLGRYRRSAWWQLYRQFPNLLRSEEDRKHDLAIDSDENARHRVDSEEELRVPIIWATEVFGPSEIDDFYAHIRNLGWDKNPRRAHDDPVRWIAEQRLYGFGGSYNIGMVTRLRESRLIGKDYRAPLPEEVDYLNVIIHQISTSITCVTIGFFLKPATRIWYREELNKDRKTFRRAFPKSRAISVLSAEHQKYEAIAKARMQYRKIAIEWFRENMSGFFSNQRNRSLLPTAELLACTRTTLLTNPMDEQRANRPRWLDPLLPIGLREVWTSTASPALSLTFGEFENESRHHLVLALRTQQVQPPTLKHNGARPDGFAHYVHSRVEEVLPHHATLAYLTEAARMVKRSREQLKPRYASGKVDKALDAITGFFTQSAGFPAVAEDLMKRATSSTWYHECADFTTQDWAGEIGKKCTLAEYYASRMKGLTEHFSKDESSTREQFEQFASIVSIKESMRAQKRMEFLTVIALVVAFLSLLASLPSISEWPQDVHKLMRAVDAIAHVRSA